MPEPEMSQWGERLRERTQPLQPDDYLYEWTHAILCEALAKPYQQIVELIDPPEPYPPWGPLFDLYACPDWALPWLCQLVGIRLPAGLDSAEVRRVIKHAAGHNVGTVAAIRASLQATLVSARPPLPATVYFRERDGSAYRLEVVTLDPETPNPALTLSVLEAVIPGGLVLDYRHIEGWDYQAMTDEYAALTPPGTYADMTLAYAGGTYEDLRQHTIVANPEPTLHSVAPSRFLNSVDEVTVFTLSGNFPDDLTTKRVIFRDAQYQQDFELTITAATATQITAEANLMTAPVGVGEMFVADVDYTPWTNSVPVTSLTEPVLDTVTPDEVTLGATNFIMVLTGVFPRISAFVQIVQGAERLPALLTEITTPGTMEVTFADTGALVAGPAVIGFYGQAAAGYPPQTNELPLTVDVAKPPPQLDSVAPASVVTGTVITLTLTGVFPDDMTGFTTDFWNSNLTGPPDKLPITKVDDATCTATGNAPPIWQDGPGDLWIADASGDDYTNTVDLTVTLAAGTQGTPPDEPVPPPPGHG